MFDDDPRWGSDPRERDDDARDRDALRAMCNPDRKTDLFRRALPHDGELHRFARHREFVERWRDFSRMVVSIPIDDVVDTESNLRKLSTTLRHQG